MPVRGGERRLAPTGNLQELCVIILYIIILEHTSRGDAWRVETWPLWQPGPPSAANEAVQRWQRGSSIGGPIERLLAFSNGHRWDQIDGLLHELVLLLLVVVEATGCGRHLI